MIVAGVDLDQAYTAEDILDMFKSGRLRALTDRGYCTQGGEDGLLRFIPYEQSLAFRTENALPNREYFSPDFADVMREDVEREHPILRRTPQERVVAMAMRIAAEARRSGATGLTDAQKKAILGEAWKEGEPLTGEQIRQLSQWFMGRAEVDNRDADSKRVTRQHMTA